MEGSLLACVLLQSAGAAGHDLELIGDAIAVASYLHRADTRAQRAGMTRVPYIEHPLRNSVRLQRYGCDIQAVIIATILHDTVEDHAFDIARDLVGLEPDSEESARGIALGYIAAKFGAEVMDLVKGVSNPITAGGLSTVEKNMLYRAHVVQAIASPTVFLVKITDFEDNAGGLHHNLEPNTVGMVRRLAAKYLPLIPALKGRVLDDDIALIIGQHSAQTMHSRLIVTGHRLELLALV